MCVSGRSRAAVISIRNDETLIRQHIGNQCHSAGVQEALLRKVFSEPRNPYYGIAQLRDDQHVRGSIEELAEQTASSAMLLQAQTAQNWLISERNSQP